MGDRVEQGPECAVPFPGLHGSGELVGDGSDGRFAGGRDLLPHHDRSLLIERTKVRLAVAEVQADG